MDTQEKQVRVWTCETPENRPALTWLEANRVFLTKLPARATILLFADADRFHAQIKHLTPTARQVIVIFTEESDEAAYGNVPILCMPPPQFLDWYKVLVAEAAPKPTPGFMNTIKRFFGIRTAA